MVEAVRFREKAAEFRMQAELPANHKIRSQLITLARQYDVLADLLEAGTEET